MYPCDNLINAAQILEKHFKLFHGDFLSDTNLIFQKVAISVKSEIPDHAKIPDDALLCLIRTRTYIRLRFLNQHLKELYPKLRAAQRLAKVMKFFS